MSAAYEDEHGHEEHAHEAGHSHVETGEFWADFMSLATSPAHVAFEFAFSVIFDLVIVTIMWGIVIKKVIIPRLRKSLHEELDAEHGIEHPKELPLK